MEGLQKELEGKADVLRVDVQDAVGGDLGRRFRVTGVPTYLVLGASGEVTHRKTYGFPDRDAVIKAVQEK